MMNGKFCGEVWNAVSRYVYTALQGGAIMKGWTNDDRMMTACCNDGTRPVIFKIERIDIPETPEEEEWLAKLFREAGKLNYRFNDRRCDVSYNGLRNIPGNCP